MNWLTPKKLLIIGPILLLLGVLIPFLMVMQVLKSTYFINFFANACQVSGLFLATYGVLAAVKINRNMK